MEYRRGCLSLVVVTIAGCGTLANLNEKELRKPYGGVEVDVRTVLGGNWFCVGPTYPAPIALVDTPFSLAGDTVTLPYTLYSTASKRYGIDQSFREYKQRIQERIEEHQIPDHPPGGQQEPE